MISLPASVIAMYSASTVNADTVACRLEDHTIGELSSSIIQPVVDLRVSWQPAQSASTHPSSGLFSFPPKVSPTVRVLDSKADIGPSATRDPLQATDDFLIRRWGYGQQSILDFTSYPPLW
ncbi:hypothetical protein EHS25_004736 [Saitozyma podzolica]|uniref:Uncharacterized protein n=1 Tax=Saitozyma podzolica TaxID=1890683 RepID=A0A427Y2N2_9TREE|nr:hypothetical protein EHS25_004736 [Saitozyma podzolica]